MTNFWTLTKYGEKRILKELMAGVISWRVKMGAYGDGRQRKPDNIDYVQNGDKFLIYFVDDRRAFCGAGILFQKKKVKDSYYLDFQTRNGDRGFEEFAQPEDYEPLKARMEWKPKSGNIRKISEKDFHFVLSNARLPWGGTEIKISHPAKEIMRRKYGSGGEGEEHRILKEWIKNHPKYLGIEKVLQAETEHIFPSGDAVDILFTLPEYRYIVVEVETWHPLPGAYQALKYRTLKCAENGLDIPSSMVKAVLVAYRMGEDVIEFCSRYAISCVRLSKEIVLWKHQE
jgi:hypothetical protein